MACVGSFLPVLSLLSPARAQSLVEKDVAYGLTLHGRIMESSSPIASGESYDKLQNIFANLKQTPTVQQGPSLPYALTYLNRPEANAFSGAGGRLYVTEGLTRITYGDSGMLAFSLGHEMAHSMAHHAFKHYLREVTHQVVLQSYRRRMAYGDKRASREMLVYLAAHKIAEGKIERDDENNADRVGLLIAAQAGYHPDFAIQLTRVMREEHPDKSKFVTFFMSDHPRWATREAKIERNYDQALSAFDARWPIVAQSPGGMPPQITTYQARNAQGRTSNQQGGARVSESTPQSPALQAANPTPIAGLVNVTFTSNPPGALVSFSGMAVAYTPCVIKLEARWYRVKMRLAGYADWAGEITVEAGKPSTVVAQMERSQ